MRGAGTDKALPQTMRRRWRMGRVGPAGIGSAGIFNALNHRSPELRRAFQKHGGIVMTEFEKALIERLDAILDEMKAARKERAASNYMIYKGVKIPRQEDVTT